MYKNKKKEKEFTLSELRKKQPEKIIYYWKEIDLRANWDMNETFNTSQNYLDLPESATSSDVLVTPDN